MRVETERQLYKMFFQRPSQLLFDGTVEENGTIKDVTTSGASLNSAAVLQALRQRDE